jgi:hypothetical protein
MTTTDAIFQLDVKAMTAKMFELNDAPPGRDYTRDRHEGLKDFTDEEIIRMAEEMRANPPAELAWPGTGD